jgi:sugar lactone lactonase YvrE
MGPVSRWLSSTLALSLAACGSDPAPRCDDAGHACTWAGVAGERGYNGEGKLRSEAWFYFIEDLTFAPDGRAYIADWNNHRIRRVETDGRVMTVVGTDFEGDGAPNMEDRLPLGSPEGALGTTVAMNHPTDVEVMPDGMVLISAWHNNKLRLFDPATNIVTVLSGDNYGFHGDGGPAYDAEFNQPKTTQTAPDGTIYTIDQRNVRIRKLAPDADRTITTIAGTGVLGNAGDGGQALDAQFGFETGITPRPSGALLLDGRTLYVADSLNNRIRRINLDTGIIDCIAGASATAGYSGDGGQAIDAKLDFPMDLEKGPDGRIYVVDRMNDVVRAIDLTTGIIERVAGAGPCASGTECVEAQEGLLATEIQLDEPYGIEFDAAGNLYIADTHNSRIVRVAR